MSIAHRKATVVTIGRGSKAEEAGLMPGDRLEAQAPDCLRSVSVSVHFFPSPTVRRTGQCMLDSLNMREYLRFVEASRLPCLIFMGKCGCDSTCMCNQFICCRREGMPPHGRACLHTFCVAFPVEGLSEPAAKWPMCACDSFACQCRTAVRT